MEKRNGKDKAWDKILGKRGELITGQRGIQKRQVEFYSELFATERNQTNEHEHSKQFFLSETSKRLSESSKIKLEEYISILYCKHEFEHNKFNEINVKKYPSHVNSRKIFPTLISLVFFLLVFASI